MVLTCEELNKSRYYSCADNLLNWRTTFYRILRELDQQWTLNNAQKNYMVISSTRFIIPILKVMLIDIN